MAKSCAISNEWGMGNGEWGMGNGEWGMGNGRRVFPLPPASLPLSNALCPMPQYAILIPGFSNRFFHLPT
ncbi:hypothetical protein A4S05_16420 [Nostoc sp. KVJ20]|nr:hypothetical protein A4S05_16420 [Nostoc sp. KVJ20]